MKIAIFEQAKKNLELIQAVTDFHFTQVDHGSMGGKDNQFIVEETNPLFVSALIEALQEHKEEVIKWVQDKAVKEVEQALIEANQEVEAFQKEHLAEVVEVQAKMMMEAQVQPMEDIKIEQPLPITKSL